MISTDRLLRAWIVLVVAAVAGRLFFLVDYYRTDWPEASEFGQPESLRERLFLTADQRIAHWVAVPEPKPGTPEVAPALDSWRMAWVCDGETLPSRSPPEPSGVAILRGSDGELLAVDVSSLLGDTRDEAIQRVTEDWLAKLDPLQLAVLPTRQLGSPALGIGVWDPNAPVYVVAGPDGAPGAAGVDDNRDGVIDDLGELGATGSDDFVVAPSQTGYQDAQSGRVLSRLISRGAVVPLNHNQLPTSSRTSEIWLDFTRFGDGDSQRHRIMLRLN